MERFYANLQKGKIAPVYLFWGPERYLLEQAVHDLRNVFSKDPELALDMQKGDAQVQSPADIVAFCEEQAFFTNGKLVLVENASVWLESAKKDKNTAGAAKKKEKAKSELDVLLAYLERPLDTTGLVLIAGEEIAANSRLAKAISICGQTVEFPYLKGSVLQNWVKNCFAAAGKTSGPQAINFLLMAVGNQLSVLSQEIKKIAAYSGKTKEVRLEDVKAVASIRPNLVVFDLVDAVVGKNSYQSITLLQQMLLYGEAEQKILALLAGQFKLLYQTKTLMQSGYRAGDIAGQLEVHPYRVQKAMAQAKFFSPEELKMALEAFLNADILQKEGELTLKDGGLEMAILKICANRQS